MNVEEVKERLGSVYTKYREYMLAEEKAEQFRNTVALSAPVPVSDAPKTEHGGSNSTENKYVAALWYYEQAGKKFRDYMLARQDAEELISSIKYLNEKEVLTRRYIMFEKWERIAAKMFLSKSRVYKLLESGVINISENL